MRLFSRIAKIGNQNCEYLDFNLQTGKCGRKGVRLTWDEAKMQNVDTNMELQSSSQTKLKPTKPDQAQANKHAETGSEKDSDGSWSRCLRNNSSKIDLSLISARVFWHMVIELMGDPREGTRMLHFLSTLAVATIICNALHSHCKCGEKSLTVIFGENSEAHQN